MNKIVRNHYPVSKLPDDLRNDVRGAETVRVTLEANDESGTTLTEVVERARRLREEGKIRPVSTQDAVARVRALRDEWEP